MHTLTLAAVAAAFGAAPSPAPAASPDPKALAVPQADVEAAAGLVRKLGSNSYRDRDAAAAELRKMGRRALPALEAGTDADDPEVRLRCEVLLPVAEADDLDARLAAFLADKDLKFQHTLPGWEKFVEATDGDPAARAFYADMMRTPACRQVFAALPKGKDEFARRLQARQAQIYQNLFPQYVNGVRRSSAVEVTGVDFATLLFGEMLTNKDAPEKGKPVGFNWLMNMVYQPAFRQAIETDKSAPVLRKLMLGWCDSWTDPNGLQMAMNITANLNMKECAKYAEKALAADKGNNPWGKAQAACMLARFGGKDKLRALEALFDDKGAMPRGPGQTAMEVRDVALVMAVTVTGGKPADYGYGTQNFGGAMNDQMKFNPWVYTLPNEEVRTKAFAKWKDERAKENAKK
jgi:hypothetical protein